MKRSLLTYSAWISLVLIMAVSCRSARVFTSGEQAEKILDSISNVSFDKISLKAKVSYKEKEVSGLMLIKKVPGENYKIAFFNELGMTFLEGTFERNTKKGNFIVKNTVSVLDNKPFIKSFEKSLQTVLTYPDISGPHASTPPRLHAPKPPCPGNNTLAVKLRNGFRLELISP